MSKRQEKTFLDKFLGFFGFRRPAKSSRRSGSVSSERTSSSGYADRRAREHSYDRRTRERGYDEGAPILDDNFEIVGTTNMKHKKKGRKKKSKRTFLKVLLSGFLVCVITFCIVVSAFMIYVFKFVDGGVDQDLNNLKLAYTSILYAENQDGDQVELKRLHGTENRLWVDLEKMPQTVKYAFISAEDKRFESHQGVDWKRTFSAFANLIFHFYDSEQGGSTITQQLVKNLTKDDETKVTRKIREIMRARYLESKYDKDVIIECYLNTIHLGNGVDGVEVASNYYFDKNVSDLTLTQAACLAAITKSPSGFDPYKNPDDNLARRNWVLNEMKNNGYITAEECEEAKTAELGLRDKPSTVLSSTNTVEEEVNSYFVDTVIEDVIQGLIDEKGYSYEYAESQLYKGGYKIYTTIDLDVQKKLEDVFADDDNFMKVRTKSDDKPQAAMTVMDYDGHIVGIVGGRGKKTGNRVLNRATQSPRQTGSSIKPITAYAPAVEYNKITWASKMVDGPISKLESGEYVGRWPVNYEGYYSGTISVLSALQSSKNTIPVKLVQQLGLKNVYNFATQRMGISTLYESIEVDGKTQSDIGESSLALGGSVYGVTSAELTAAYVPFGNLGIYYKPKTYTVVKDQYDNVVLDTEETSKRAISEESANIMCEMLQTVTTSGTATQAQFGDWPIMSKTGTTTDTKDRWFVGGTPYYVSAVWFGMDNSEAMGGLYSNPALKIWKAAMQEIHEDLKLKDFPESDSVEYRKYCRDSGMVATTGCSNTSYGYFKSSYQPLCNIHSGKALDAADKPAAVGSVTTTKKSSTTKSHSESTSTAANNTKSQEETAAKTNPAKTEKKTEQEKPKETQAKTSGIMTRSTAAPSTAAARQ